MLSVVILTKNEEKNIFDCIESVKWADEILIIDDYSTDLTEQVIKHFASYKKIKFVKRRLDNDFSSQRNFAISKARYDWIFFLDADERVTPELREEMNSIMINEKNRHSFDGFFIQRKDYIWGKKLNYGEAGKIKLLRLGYKNSGLWEGKVHEVWNIKGKVGELDNYLIHFPHQTISEFLNEINFYTSLRAKELFLKKNKIYPLEILSYPLAKFIYSYLFKLGFMDGVEGLLFAIFMSFHSFLVRAKLWLLWEQK